MTKTIHNSNISMIDSLYQFKYEMTERYLIMTLDMLQNNGLVLDDCQIVDVESHNIVNDSLLFIDGHDHLLVCRISEFDCESCCDYALERSIDVFNEYKTNLSMAVFGQYNDDRSLMIYGKNHSNYNDIKYYNVWQLKLPMEKHGNPYYFVLDKNMVVTDFFSPDRMAPELTKMYFDMIINKWQ